MNNVNIAVVIVTYKCADLTIDCLHSVQKERDLNRLNIQVIVVDNASGDAPQISDAVTLNHWTDWVTVLTSPRNGGFGYGNNLGVQYALQHFKVDYFHFLNPDTELRDSAIFELVKFFNSHPNAGIAGGSFELLDGELWPYAFHFPTLFSEFSGGLQWGFVDKILKRWVVAVEMTQTDQRIDWISGASMLMRRSVVEQLRGFDESFFLYFEETDLCLRAKRLGIETWYVPASRVMHNSGQSTKVSQHNAAPKRLPKYWFDSRRRYFMVNHGILYTICADMLTILANAVGHIKTFIKSLLTDKTDKRVPNYILDIFTNSPLLPGNRVSAPFTSSLSVIDADTQIQTDVQVTDYAG